MVTLYYCLIYTLAAMNEMLKQSERISQHVSRILETFYFVRLLTCRLHATFVLILSLRHTIYKYTK